MRRKIDGMARARRHARFFRLQRTFWIAGPRLHGALRQFE